MKTYASVYLGSAILAIAGTPLVARLAKRWKKLLDKPGVRKVHDRPIPRVGGIAIVAAMLLLVLPVLLLSNDIGQAFRKVQGRVITLLACGVFVFLVGLVDDIRNLPAKIKLLCLVGAAVAVCASGARIHSISARPLFELQLGWVSWPVTVLWIVGVTVALNFMDGLDGLAAGIGAIVCGVIAAMAFYSGQVVMGVLMLALLGSLTGFLCFNFNPAKIFMGDCGSMFLGFIIGAGSVVCATKKYALLGIAIPGLALGVPILDAALTMIRRGILDRRSIFTAERGHIHHRLLDKGLQHRNVVLIIYAATLLGAGMGMCLLIAKSLASLLVFGAAILFLVLLFHFVGAARLGETIKAIRRNRAIARGGRQDKDCFEDAQLGVREAKSFEDWWEALTGLADKMEFERVAFAIRTNGAWTHTTVWRRPGQQLSPEDVVSMTMPVGDRDGNGGPVSWFEVAVQRNGSLETVGRRMMYFGRLIDESGAAERLPQPPPASQQRAVDEPPAREPVPPTQVKPPRQTSPGARDAEENRAP